MAHTSTSTRTLRALLRSRSLRATPARVRILGAFFRARRPIRADDVMKAVKGKADPVTVYRAIAAFEKRGIIKRIELKTRFAHYELALLPDHHHITCTSCGRIESFTGCRSRRIIADALCQTRHFTRIDDHSLELFGVCTTCEK